MVIRAGVWATAALFTIGCVEIIGLEVGQRREAAATAGSGGRGQGGDGGDAGTGGACTGGQSSGTIESFCDKYCYCVQGGESCFSICTLNASMCVQFTVEALESCMAGRDRCCTTLCAEIECVSAESCWTPPAGTMSGCR